MKRQLLILFTLTLCACRNEDSDATMGLLDKLFGKKKTPAPVEKAAPFQLDKTAEMLDEDLFWSIIDQSLKNTNNQDQQEQFLIREISKLTPKQMVGFRLRTDKLLYDTYNSEMWCAAYIMNGGCSDDAFEYFRNWLISRGKETFYSAKQNPDNLIDVVNPDEEYYEFEGFWYVALEAFQRTTKTELYDYIDEENFQTKEGHYPQFEFNWEEDDPESMKLICPRLFARFLEN